MGNRIGNLCLCSAGAGEISGRFENRASFLSKQHDRALGNSICYVRPDTCQFSGDSISDDDVTLMTFRSVSGATVSANPSATPSTSLDNSLQHGTVLDSSASFESSGSFTSTIMVPFQHQLAPRGFSVGRSTERELSWGRCDRVVNGAGSVEKGSSEAPLKKLKRSLSHGGYVFQNKTSKRSLKRVLNRAFFSFGKMSIFKKNDNFNARVSCSTSLSAELSLHGVEGDNNYLDDDGDGCDVLKGCENLHWAQGRGGEDRVHIVICEDHGWVFVGIYDGFNGPDATDFLLNNLFYAVYDVELQGMLCSQKNKEVNGEKVVELSHSEVLQGLSEALRKSEDAFLRNADEMIAHSPVLAMMGSCVLVVLMKGQDVYLMNVGDSRAVLATNTGNSLQLTMEHSTHVKEEVYRIRREHPDDPFAVTKGRVKGCLSVTRAFGAGFLKQPKQNNAVLETFKVRYIGESPYITCSPSLHHHRLSPHDKFLILSSDGLYQYFTNEEAVAKVDSFISMFPDRDPAQLLIEEALSRAAKKAGMEFHELLDIPQGERRHYHDDISVVIISLEGKIWRSLV
ncbi:probable protein phosphatase 2C 4 [Abrus precatorius]|uniref:Probable protein phosphatase 2C 4 n=1 Tax=Abrus precatorius TaxID=3816 RepID=A0A8B8LEM4_ABRPR|nr:probable protein phosphatase 2C 4 [Abrus precatorius]